MTGVNDRGLRSCVSEPKCREWKGNREAQKPTYANGTGATGYCGSAARRWSGHSRTCFRPCGASTVAGTRAFEKRMLVHAAAITWGLIMRKRMVLRAARRAWRKRHSLATSAPPLCLFSTALTTNRPLSGQKPAPHRADLHNTTPPGCLLLRAPTNPKTSVCCFVLPERGTAKDCVGCTYHDLSIIAVHQSGGLSGEDNNA